MRIGANDLCSEESVLPRIFLALYLAEVMNKRCQLDFILLRRRQPQPVGNKPGNESHFRRMAAAGGFARFQQRNGRLDCCQTTVLGRL
jgi:hypothetical protein